MKEQFILIGGGTARFTDRPSILEADYAYTPIYREIASFVTPCTTSVLPAIIAAARPCNTQSPESLYWTLNKSGAGLFGLKSLVFLDQ